MARRRARRTMTLRYKRTCRLLPETDFERPREKWRPWRLCCTGQLLAAGFRHRFKIVRRGWSPGGQARPCAMPVNMLNIAVPLTRRRDGRRAGNRVLSRRRDEARARAMALHNPPNRIADTGAVAHERDDGFTHLAQQRYDVSGVVHVPGREIEADDLAGVGVETDMQLRPGSAPCRAVLFDLPFRSTAEPQAGAGHDQMRGSHPDRAKVAPPGRLPGGWGRNDPGRPDQLSATAEPISADPRFAAGQDQDDTQAQHHHDSQIEIDCLPPRVVRLGARPAASTLWRHPYRQAATVLKRLVVGQPVTNPVLCPQNIVPAPGVQFMRPANPLRQALLSGGPEGYPLQIWSLQQSNGLRHADTPATRGHRRTAAT